MRVETTFGGAGVLTGDLSPECASIVGTVLDALSAPAGAEDARSQPQRCHDALQEAMRRLVTAGLLPERAGQPVKAVVHISLADLMRLEGSSALLQEWTSRVRAQWAGHRARASAGGGGGGAWLDGDAAEAVACDAAMVPFVTGDVNPGALDDLVRLCVQLDRLRRHHAGDDPQRRRPPRAPTATSPTAILADGTERHRHRQPRPAAARRIHAASDTALAWEALERAIIGKAVDLLSGPGGLASFLRRRQLGARLAARASRWTSASPASQPGSATPSSSATSTANGPEAATSPPAPARSTTSSTRRTAERPASKTGATVLLPPPNCIHRWGWTWS